MEHECIIGLLGYIDYSDLCSLKDLETYVEDQKEMVGIDKSTFPRGSRFKWNTDITIYFDKRRSCNLERFNFCPTCGKKIDWEGLKERNINK